MTDSVLVQLINMVGNNLDKIPNPPGPLNRIMGHEKISAYALSALFFSIIRDNLDKIPNAFKFLSGIIDHKKINAYFLYLLFQEIVEEKFDEIPGALELLKQIIHHEKIDHSFFSSMVTMIENNFDGRPIIAQKLLNEIAERKKLLDNSP